MEKEIVIIRDKRKNEFTNGYYINKLITYLANIR